VSLTLFTNCTVGHNLYPCTETVGISTVFVHGRVVDLEHLKLAIVYKQHQDANATVYKNVYTPTSNRKTSGRKQFLKFHVFGLFGHET
jgi:hypothetical protein